MNIIQKILTKAIAAVTGEKNLINETLYKYTAGGMPYLLDANNENYINEAYKANIHVYSVVSSIIDRCSGIPIQVKKGADILPTSQLGDLLKRPNPSQSWEEFIQAYAGWKLLTGNVYIYQIWPDAGLNKGKPSELWLLPAHITEIIGGGVTQPVEAYRIALGPGMFIKIPAEQIIHDKYFNPGYDIQGSQMYGQSPLQAAMLTIQAANTGYVALNKAYQHGAPAGILTGSESAEHEYTPEQIKTLEGRWSKKYGGAENYMRLIFHRSPLQWIKMGYSVVDMNIVELMKFSLQDICNIYHAPIHLFNAQAATLDNYKEARKAIYTDCVMPIFDSMINKLNATLVKRYEADLSLAYDTSVITELNADMGILASALNTAYWMTGNEKRVAMGLQPLDTDPMLNEILYPASLTPGLELGNQPTDDLGL